MISLNEINDNLVYSVWEDNCLKENSKDILNELLENQYKELSGRSQNKNIIHIGLDDPSTTKIGNQCLMFGPAGNCPRKPEIIITGISTSITAANGIAEQLKGLNVKDLNSALLQNIYLTNIYKGRMYKKFKDTFSNAAEGNRWEDSFQELFNGIEGKGKLDMDSNIMVTQLTLHGVATYFEDKRNNKITWGSPSTKVFKNQIAKELYQSFFVEKVLKERFLDNSEAKALFVMGDDAFKKVKKTIEEIGKNTDTMVEFKELNNNNFKLDNTLIPTNTSKKFVFKIRHPAAR